VNKGKEEEKKKVRKGEQGEGRRRQRKGERGKEDKSEGDIH